LFSLFPPGFPAVPHYFTHTKVVPSPSQNRACAIYAHGSSHGHLCGVVSFPPVPRFCERPVSLYSALPCVASFPPAALPAFTGTMKLSDSLRHICLPPSSVVRHTLDLSKEAKGLPGCREILMSDMPWSQTPEKPTLSCH
jgi:hypothetical protein